MHELKVPENGMMTQMTSLHEERLDFVLRTLKSTGAGVYSTWVAVPARCSTACLPTHSSRA